MHANAYRNQLRAIKPKQLSIQAQKNATRNELVESVLQYMYCLGSDISWRHQGHSYWEQMDCIQDANVAAILAAEKFDRDYGVKFMTFVKCRPSWEWQGKMLKAISQGNTVSANAPIRDDADFTVIDTIEAPDKTDESADASLLQQKIRKAIDEADSLTPKERFIINERLYTNDPITLAKAGEVMGYTTRERARQIEKKAIQKLSVILKEFKEYL